MATAHLRSKPGPKGATYYAEFYDPARTPTRRWVSLRTRDRRAAEIAFADWVRDEATGRRDPWNAAHARPGTGASDRLAATDLIALYLDARAPVVRPNTLAQNRVAFGHLLGSLPRGGREAARSLTAEHVRRALDHAQGRGGGPAAPATRRVMFAAYYALFSWAVRRGYLAHHPLGQEPVPPGDVRPFYLLSPDEVRALTAHARAHPGRGRQSRAFVADLVELAVGSGIRLGELRQLTWADVRDEDGEGLALHVVHDPRRGRTTKTGQSRRVVVFPIAARALEHLRARAAEVLGRAPRGSDPVALTAAGTRLNDSRITHLFRQHADAVGLADARFHDLRHAFISWSVNELSMPLTVVQAQAGHRDVKRTAAYQRVTGATAHEATLRALALAGVAPRPAPSSAFAQVARFLADLPADASASSTHLLQPSTSPYASAHSGTSRA